jgi:isoamyl acetate esterase
MSSPAPATPLPSIRPQVVLFGDSITQNSFSPGGWGARMAHWYVRKADVVNRGLSGYNSPWALATMPKVRCASACQFQAHAKLRVRSPACCQAAAITTHAERTVQVFPKAAAEAPLLVTVLLGANDAALPGAASGRQHVPVATYAATLREIVAHLRSIRVETIVLITPPPIDEEARAEFYHEERGVTLSEPERTDAATRQYADACLEVRATSLCVAVYRRMRAAAGADARASCLACMPLTCLRVATPRIC